MISIRCYYLVSSFFDNSKSFESFSTIKPEKTLNRLETQNFFLPWKQKRLILKKIEYLNKLNCIRSHKTSLFVAHFQ